MSTPRTLQGDTPEDVLDDLLFTEGALEADPDAADLVPVIAGQIEQWESSTRVLRAALRKEIKAEALANVRDASLDDVILRFADNLLHAVGKNADDPRFRRYFKQPPSRFIRNARLEEATTVKSWITSIKGEPESEVSAYAALLEKAATASIEALDLVATAAGERASCRVKEWGGYVRRVDAARDALFADLVKRGQERKKPRDWPSRFFRTRGRARKGGDESEAGGATTPS